jgi:hypothetical protein
LKTEKAFGVRHGFCGFLRVFVGRRSGVGPMGKVTNLFDSFAVQCECGNTGMTLLRSGKVLCEKCGTTWTNLTWNCRECPGDRKCCRNGGNVGGAVEG